jgi:hypothetical protein
MTYPCTATISTNIYYFVIDKPASGNVNNGGNVHNGDNSIANNGYLVEGIISFASAVMIANI